jgi:methylmalonyl-CoA mutase
MMSKLDPHVNILRATIACASAGLGGADSIAVVPHTAVNGLPDAHARRIARNVQVVLMEESSLARVADPAGGSFALETLTRELGAKAWSLFQEIEAKGGMAEALASGFIADGISRVAEARGRLIADKKMPLTGVTSFAAPATTRIGAEPLPAAATIEQAATRIAPLKLRRPAEPYEVQT